jgi:hypothetical protein
MPWRATYVGTAPIFPHRRYRHHIRCRSRVHHLAYLLRKQALWLEA